MFKTLCILFGFCLLVTESFAGLAPYTKKCEWNNKACLIEFTQLALPVIVSGLPDFELTSLDPLSAQSVEINEGDIKVVFKDITINGIKSTRVTDVERNINEKWMKFTFEGPIDMRGNYVASGKFFGTNVEGDGPFHIQADKAQFTLINSLTTFDGKDGQKHFKSSVQGYTFEFLEKPVLSFENIFNGDQEKAAAVTAVLNQSWKEVGQIYGKLFIKEIVHTITANINKFYEAVPTSDLEK